jgi:hypothetical protein
MLYEPKCDRVFAELRLEFPREISALAQGVDRLEEQRTILRP